MAGFFESPRNYSPFSEARNGERIDGRDSQKKMNPEGKRAKMKGYRKHQLAGATLTALLVIASLSLAFTGPAAREGVPVAAARGQQVSGVAAPVADKVTLTGREVARIPEVTIPEGTSALAVSPKVKEGVKTQPSEGDAESKPVDGGEAQKAIPSDKIPIPETGVNPPTDLAGTFVPQQKPYVLLKWNGNNHPKFLREFRIYRVVAGEELVGDPAPIDSTKKEQYQDFGLELGKTYVYWVTAVSKSGEESAPSNTVEVVTYQNLPPQTPQGLTAAAIDPGVCLDWLPNPESDVIGYMVYMMSGGVYQKLTAQPVTENHFYHPTGVAGNVYAVTAVNVFGTESGYAVAEASPAAPSYFEEYAAGVMVEGLWVSEAYPEASGGRILVAGSAGDRLHFKFTGRQVKVISAMYWTCGSAAMYIDGEYITTVNLYSYDPVFGSVTMDVPGLVYGEHTLTIEVLGTGNPETNLYFVNVDAFEVL